MKKVRIVSLLGFLIASINVMAVDIKNFSGEMKVCNTPSYNCSAYDSARLQGGKLTVEFKYEGYDDDSYTIDYKIVINNSSDCKIQIGVMKLKHGSKQKMIDWGLIELEVGEDDKSRTQTFHMSKRATQNYDSMKLKYSGLAYCPD